MTPETNPFSSHRIRPGAIPYLFAGAEPSDAGLDQLTLQLRDADWQSQIVGPHGTGKSTLLAALEPKLVAAGREIVRYTLHAGERRLPGGWQELATAGSQTQLVIDGYEQLSRWQRWRLAWFCARMRCGMLVTTHTPMHLPTLLSTQVPQHLAERVVAELLGQDAETQQSADWSTIQPEDVARLLTAHQGNLRDTLFALYDLYEARRG